MRYKFVILKENTAFCESIQSQNEEYTKFYNLNHTHGLHLRYLQIQISLHFDFFRNSVNPREAHWNL